MSQNPKDRRQRLSTSISLGTFLSSQFIFHIAWAHGAVHVASRTTWAFLQWLLCLWCSHLRSVLDQCRACLNRAALLCARGIEIANKLSSPIIKSIHFISFTQQPWPHTFARNHRAPVMCKDCVVEKAPDRVCFIFILFLLHHSINFLSLLLLLTSRT